jgi:Ni/Co efflux regulator RcnB
MISRVFRSVGTGSLAALAAAVMLAAAQPASAQDGRSGWDSFRQVHDAGGDRWNRGRGDQYAWWFDRDRHRSDWRRDRDRRRNWDRGERRRDRDWGSRYKGEDHRRNGWINPSGGGGS